MKQILTYKLVFLAVLISSCFQQKSSSPTFKKIQNLNVVEFKKKNVDVRAEIVVENPTDMNMKHIVSTTDVLINGIDVGTYVHKDERKVDANSFFAVPVKVNFKAEKVLKEYDAGMIKIKSEHVVDIEFKGIVTLRKDDKEFKIKVNESSKLLLSNDASLTIDEAGNIIKR